MPLTTCIHREQVQVIKKGVGAGMAVGHIAAGAIILIVAEIVSIVEEAWK